MADAQPLPEICCLKSTEILVHVEEALLDFLVISYEYDSKLYQGVLLDSSKRSLPCGILPSPGFAETDSAQHGLGTDEDKMYSVAQRYSYFQGKSPPHMSVQAKDAFPPGSAYHMRRAIKGGQSKLKNSRMTVRLRPRQVLCSKCKSICNENSENVDLSRKRRSAESSSSTNGPAEKKSCPPRQISPKSPRPPFSENPQDNKPSNALASRRKNSSSTPVDSTPIHQSLIPKTVKESETPQTLDSNVNKVKIVPEYWPKQPNELNVQGENRRTRSMPRNKANSQSESGPAESPEETSVHCLEANEIGKSTDEDPLETKTSVVYGSDVYDGNSSIEVSDNADSLSKLNSSFASSETDESHDRMVLRKKRNVGSMEDLWDESVFLEDTARRTTPVIKISFGTQGEGTVLKIPAKVRSYHESESDFEDLAVNQPKTPTKEAMRTKAAKKALKKAKKEARRKVNGDRPGSSSPGREASTYQRRRKRKVKHKKRHKGVRAQQESNTVEEEMDIEVPPLSEEDPLKLDDQPNDEKSTIDKNCDIDSIRENCLKQKLSINLKRLNGTAYARCGDTSCSTGSDSPGSNSEFSGADDLPDFPKLDSNQTFLTVESCDTGDGRTMEVGDVVWGKIHGFPWWPGKVLSITIERKEDPQRPQAHVAWYGSSTSSRMPCDQLCPFLETFKTRYNKKKRGPYKEAIRQATSEARKESLDPLQDVDAVL